MSEASPEPPPGTPAAPILAGHRLEVAETAVLAAASLATAWCGYQSARWSGLMSISFTDAQSQRSDAVLSGQDASSQTEVDLAMFTEWLRAILADQAELAPLIRRQFSAELESAVTSWLSAEGSNGTGTPFTEDRYRLPGRDAVNASQAEAEKLFGDGLQANQNSDNYVLLTVVFALVLLLVALGAKLQWRAVRLGMFGLGVALFLVAAATALTIPVH